MRQVLGTWAETYDGAEGGKLLVVEEKEEKYVVLAEEKTGSSVSFIAQDAEKALLFALLEIRQSGKDAGGLICQYDCSAGKPVLLKAANSCGAYPVDMILTREYAVVLNHGSTKNWIVRTERTAQGGFKTCREYDEASLVLFARDEDGTTGDILDLCKIFGHGDLAFFQDSASPHSLFFYEAEEEIYVPERGTDQVSVFAIDRSAGRLEKVGILESEKGYGPRNVIVSGGGEYVYVMHEIAPVIAVYRRRKTESGTLCFERIQELHTVSDEMNDRTQHEATSFEAPHPVDMGITGDGKMLFCLTRSVNCITAFSIGRDGKLAMEQCEKMKGVNPRQLAIDRNGLLAVALDSGTVERWDIKEGKAVWSHYLVSGIPRLAVMGKVCRI